MTAGALRDQELLTIEQWETANSQSERRLELVKGRLVEMTEGTQEHGDAITAIFLAVYDVLPKGLWRVRPANGGVAASRKNPQSGLIPDILVVRHGAGGRKTRTYESVDALLAVEVISPGSTKRDRVDKRELYERAGVANYWIVDIREESRGPKLTVLRLVNGAYHELDCGPDAQGEVVIPDLAGVEVRFRWDDLVD